MKCINIVKLCDILNVELSDGRDISVLVIFNFEMDEMLMLKL